MYDAPQCKVLIAGQSYMKCMELKRMLNWAEEGFRLVLEQNICSCETPLERVNPDILILVGITGWMRHLPSRFSHISLCHMSSESYLSPPLDVS